MLATKQKRVTYTSPKGTFKFPSLSKPDFGNEKFPKPDGEYKTSLIVPLAEAQALIDKLTPEWDAAIALGKDEFAKLPLPARKKFGSVKEQPFYQEEYDPVTEEPTGNVTFTFKTKYKIIDKKSGETRFNAIGLFDAKGKPLVAGTAVYAGTVGKIAFQVSGYFVAGQAMAGISLRLSAAQIIDLVGPGARTATQYGFAEEDGYETAAAEDTFGDESSPAPAAPAHGNPQDF